MISKKINKKTTTAAHPECEKEQLQLAKTFMDIYCICVWT